MSGEQLCKRLGRVPVQYSNRRFSISALDLGSDRMRFEVDNGQLLALGYVCDPRIPPLDVAMGGEVHRAAMMKGGVRDGTYKFLVSMLSFEFLYGTKLLEARGNVALTYPVPKRVWNTSCMFPKTVPTMRNFLRNQCFRSPVSCFPAT